MQVESEDQEATVAYQEKVMSHIRDYASGIQSAAFYEMILTISYYWIGLQFSSLWLAPIFALVFVRMFIIFHDMAHGSFFTVPWMNRFGALITGTMVFTSTKYWISGHNHHHSNSNKLNRTQHAQTAAWEVKKYQASSDIVQRLYRMFYGRFTLFTINPLIYFLVVHRIVSGFIETCLMGIYLWMLTSYLDGWQMVYYFVSIWIAGIYGFILFHAQHTFDGVYRAYSVEDCEKIKEKDPDAQPEQWNYFMNGMKGCSFLQVPWILRTFTCGIEYHHIHHLNSKVPCYLLAKCHKNGEELFAEVPRVTLTQVLRSLHYSLYDTEKKEFCDVYQTPTSPPS